MFNPVAVRTYCKIVFANPPLGGLVALRGYAEKGRGGAPYLVWVDPFVPNWTDAVVDFVAQCNNRGLASYCVPGFVRGHKAGAADVLTLPTLLVDIDSGDIAAKAIKAARLIGTPTLAVHSGGAVDGQLKTHLYWSLTGDTNAPRVARLRGLLARAIGADTSFEEGREHQPIRIAGSVHRKDQPVPVAIAYTSESSLDVHDKIAHLEIQTRDIPQNRGSNALSNGGPPLDNSTVARNNLGLLRRVSLDELPMRTVGHGDPEITRFEAITRMIGTMISSISDINNDDEVERQFGYFVDWARVHIENVERDYSLRQHWNGLMRRERWKRTQPRRPRARKWNRGAGA